MKNGANQKLSLPGLAFTSIGGGVGVAMVAYLGLVVSSAGKGTILTIFICLGMGLLSAAPYWLLSRKTVLKGGQYSLIVEGMGPVPAAVSVYIQIIGALFMVTYPTSVITYVVSIAPGIAPFSKVLSILVAVVTCWLLCNNINVFEKVQSLLTILLIVGLAMFIVLGGIHIAKSGVNVFDFSTDPIWKENGINGALSAVPLIAATCYGYIWVVYYGPVAQKPTRNIPIAALYGALVMCAFWIGLAIVNANVLPTAEVAGKPLTYVAEVLFSKPIAVLFVIAGPIMCIYTSYIGLIQTPVAMFSKAAGEGWLPKIFARKNGKGRYSAIYIMILAISVAAILLDIWIPFFRWSDLLRQTLSINFRKM